MSIVTHFRLNVNENCGKLTRYPQVVENFPLTPIGETGILNLMAAPREKKVLVEVWLSPDQLMKIEWLQEKTPASRGYFIRMALDEFLADVRPPGLENRS